MDASEYDRIQVLRDLVSGLVADCEDADLLELISALLALELSECKN